MIMFKPFFVRLREASRAQLGPRAFAAFLAIAFSIGFARPAHAAPVEGAQTAWRLLDYIAVDYRGAVSNGRVISTSEYAEMVEFSGSIEARIAELPATSAKTGLQAEAKSLKQAIASKAQPATVAKIARAMAGGESGGRVMMSERSPTISRRIPPWNFAFPVPN